VASRQIELKLADGGIGASQLRMNRQRGLERLQGVGRFPGRTQQITDIVVTQRQFAVKPADGRVAVSQLLLNRQRGLIGLQGVCWFPASFC
jgi:hypothetical protein